MIVGSTVLLWSAATHLIGGQIWDHVSSDIFGHASTEAPSSAKEVWTEVPLEAWDLLAPALGVLADFHNVRSALVISLLLLLVRTPVVLETSELLGPVHVVQAAQMAIATSPRLAELETRGPRCSVDLGLR